LVQTEATAAEYLPAPQSTQLPFPKTPLNVPEGHAVQGPSSGPV
jgi:hypothetical protein